MAKPKSRLIHEVVLDWCFFVFVDSPKWHSVVETCSDDTYQALCFIICINCTLLYAFVGQYMEGKIKGQIEVTRRRGRRRKKLLDDFKDRRGYRQLKEEALDRTMWRNRFGRGFRPVV